MPLSFLILIDRRLSDRCWLCARRAFHTSRSCLSMVDVQGKLLGQQDSGMISAACQPRVLRKEIGPEGGHTASHRTRFACCCPAVPHGRPGLGAAEAVGLAWQQEALKMCELSRFPWQLGPRVLVPSSWAQPDDWHEPHALPALRRIGRDGGFALLRPWLVAGEQRLASAPGSSLFRCPCAARGPAKPWAQPHAVMWCWPSQATRQWSDSMNWRRK